MKQKLFFLPFLLLLLTESEGFDGCDLNEYRCGSICIWGNAQCHCGDTTISFTENWHQYCCTDKDCKELGTSNSYPIPPLLKEVKYFGDGVCTDGSVTPINASCHGKCYLNDKEKIIGSKSSKDIVRINTTNKYNTINTNFKDEGKPFKSFFPITVPKSFRISPVPWTIRKEITLQKEIILEAGTTIPAGSEIPDGLTLTTEFTLEKGFEIPFDFKTEKTIKMGTTLPSNIVLPPGFVFPSGTTLQKDFTLTSGQPIFS